MAGERGTLAASPGAARALAFARSFATTCRNASIYPRTHPRVADAAAQLVATLRDEALLPLRVWLRGPELIVAGTGLSRDDAQVAWLWQRLRRTSLRGFELGAAIEPLQLVEFALSLASGAVAGGSGGALAVEHVRTLELRYAGDHGDIAATNQEPLGDPFRAERTRDVADRLAADPRVQRELTALAKRLAHEHPDGTGDVALVQALAELLPIGATDDHEFAGELAASVLQGLQQEFDELDVRDQRPAPETALVQRAMQLARRYFVSSVTEATGERPLPTGRPGDERFVADAAALDVELARLPATDGLQVPPTSELDSRSPLLAATLFGIYLHLFVHVDRPPIANKLAEVLAEELQQLDTDKLAVLAAWLGTDDESLVDSAARERLLQLLLANGLGALLPELCGLDAALARGGPQLLAAALRGLVVGAEEQLAEQLRRLAEQVPAAQLRDAGRHEAFADPALIERLAQRTEPAASALLAGIAAAERDVVRAVLVRCARPLALPAPEAALLGQRDSEAALPLDYLAALYDAIEHRRVTAELRARTAQRLRHVVQQALPDAAEAEIGPLLALLQHAPGPATEALLEQLSSRRSLLVIGARERTLRRTAEHMLSLLRRGRGTR